jgi:hypothetical protein
MCVQKWSVYVKKMVGVCWESYGVCIWKVLGVCWKIEGFVLGKGFVGGREVIHV